MEELSAQQTEMNRLQAEQEVKPCPSESLFAIFSQSICLWIQFMPTQTQTNKAIFFCIVIVTWQRCVFFSSSSAFLPFLHTM